MPFDDSSLLSSRKVDVEQSENYGSDTPGIA